MVVEITNLGQVPGEILHRDDDVVSPTKYRSRVNPIEGKARRDDPKSYKILLWSCCNCKESFGLTVKVNPVCPELDCQHIRCDYCMVESIEQTYNWESSSAHSSLRKNDEESNNQGREIPSADSASTTNEKHGDIQGHESPSIREVLRTIDKDGECQDHGFSSIHEVLRTNDKDSKIQDESCDLSRTSSLASIADSLFSITIGSSMSSVAGPQEAIGRLVRILNDDFTIRTLCIEALSLISTDRFERNLRRLLKRFAVALRNESSTQQHRQAAQFVRYRARNTAHILRNTLCLEKVKTTAPIQPAMNSQPLPSTSLFDLTVEVDDASDISSDTNDEEEVDSLHQLEDFILTSEAIITFRENLRSFIYSSPPARVSPVAKVISTVHVTTEQGQEVIEAKRGKAHADLPESQNTLDKGQDIANEKLQGVTILTRMSFVSQLYLRLSEVFTKLKARLKLPGHIPPVESGKSRLVWTCKCGHEIVDDFIEVQPGAVERLRREFSATQQSKQRHASQSRLWERILNHRLIMSIPAPSLELEAGLLLFSHLSLSLALNPGMEIYTFPFILGPALRLRRNVVLLRFQMGDYTAPTLLNDLSPITSNCASLKTMSRPAVNAHNAIGQKYLTNLIMYIWVWATIAPPAIPLMTSEALEQGTHTTIRLPAAACFILRILLVVSFSKYYQRLLYSLSGQSLRSDSVVKHLDTGLSTRLGDSTAKTTSENPSSTKSGFIWTSRLLWSSGSWLKNTLGLGSKTRSDPEMAIPLHSLSNAAPCIQPTPTPPPPTELLYLLLCYQSGRYATRLLQLDLVNLQASCDKSLFNILHSQYQSIRGKWQRYFSLRTLESIKFVHFQIYKSELVDVRKQDDIPPPGHMDYKYAPVPLDVIPPVGDRHMMHLFNNPQCAESAPILLTRFPKKLHQKLLCDSLIGVNPGWGLQFIENWDFKKIWIIAIILFGIGSLVVGVVWALLMKSVQDAFAIAAYMVALAMVSVGTLQALLVM